ncbi:MAG TPA: acetamidase/formamidase family protein [bacterium]|nr:acetamidase/formamidase family protein [bacterium]
MKAAATVCVAEYTNGILDPKRPMLGPVKDGGYIVANTAPGCWGPMITPALRGGHEVTKPVFVEGAEVGDAIVVRIKSVEITSKAAASGVDFAHPDRYEGDPFVASKCESCGQRWPESEIQGVGPDAIRCQNCGSPVSTFNFAHGYTMVFDDGKRVGITVPAAKAEAIAADGHNFMHIPANSIQHPSVTLAPADLTGVAARLRPFLGQLGTMPGVKCPDSHNAGDFGSFLIDAPHPYALTPEQLLLRTDGHMDINWVRPGSIVICPVKAVGGGIYVGDAHAMQGGGEIAGHTVDVAATVILQVSVIKGLGNEGPILLPLLEDLPILARPLTVAEQRVVAREVDKWGVKEPEQSLPLSFVGTGENLNLAIDNALERAAGLLEMDVNEVKNRSTITGSIEIGRAPGVVTATFLVPVDILARLGLLEIVQEQYGC